MMPTLAGGKGVLSRRLLLQRRNFRRPQSTLRNEAKSATNTAPRTPSSSAATVTHGSSRTIPGPIWLWTQPLNAYSRVHKRSPYTIQVISAAIIYFIGDLTAQNLSPSPPKDTVQYSKDSVKSAGFWSSYDSQRTLRSLIIGMSAAIPGYNWFLFLARNFNYASKVKSLVVKVVVNQMAFTPIFNSYFFGLQSLLSGASVGDVVERIKNTVPRSWYNSWKLWPVVTAFSFTFVRVEFRGIFAGVIAIGWQAYLSMLNQRAAKMEKDTHETQHLSKERIQAAAKSRRRSIES